MSALRTAVIGVGFFGKLHAQKHAALPQANLVAVVDIDPRRADAAAAELGVEAAADYRDLLGAVDAVSVAVPTADHYAIARAFLEAGTHVLVEKPITDDPADAKALVELARARSRVLQVGHLERFSAARLGLEGILNEPMFVDCQRIAPFKARGTDINVILDMMIHDIDFVLDIVKAPIVDIDAIGVPVISPEEDIANARIRFANGCVATVTASRVSLKTERKIRLFQHDAYIRLDLQENKINVVRKAAGARGGGFFPVETEERDFDEGDSLMREIEAFLAAVTDGTPPLVSGEDGLRALECAIAITKSMRSWANSLGRAERA